MLSWASYCPVLAPSGAQGAKRSSINTNRQHLEHIDCIEPWLEEKLFDFGRALLSSLQELDILQRDRSPPEDHAGQVGQLLQTINESPLKKHPRTVLSLWK